MPCGGNGEQVSEQSRVHCGENGEQVSEQSRVHCGENGEQVNRVGCTVVRTVNK